MTRSSLAQEVIVGVDTHRDVHVAVAINRNGQRLADLMVPTTEAGCHQLHGWALTLGQRVCYGVEGTGSYGAGLSRYLRARGCSVMEIRGPNRKLRHDRGKSDPIDAEAAARTVLAGTSAIALKAGDALCRVSPLPASSGKTTRHRLNCGGNREANCALYRVAMSRLSFEPRTQAYARRRSAEGLSKKEIIRCLKRYIAREIFAVLPDLASP